MTAGHVYVRIYWEDTDAGGVVYHASYLRFMERGRTELLRERGIDQGALLSENGLIFVVTHMDIKFRAAAKIDDELDVETALKEIGGATVVLTQKVRRGTDVLVTADVTCAVISQTTGRPARLPADIKKKLGAVSLP
jgi:acyl-CoA thioester hydrolase